MKSDSLLGRKEWSYRSIFTSIHIALNIVSERNLIHKQGQGRLPIPSSWMPRTLVPTCCWLRRNKMLKQPALEMIEREANISHLTFKWDASTIHAPTTTAARLQWPPAKSCPQSLPLIIIGRSVSHIGRVAFDVCSRPTHFSPSLLFTSVEDSIVSRQILFGCQYFTTHSK